MDRPSLLEDILSRPHNQGIPDFCKRFRVVLAVPQYVMPTLDAIAEATGQDPVVDYVS